MKTFLFLRNTVSNGFQKIGNIPPKANQSSTMGNKSVETLCHIVVLKGITFLISTILPPVPFSMLDFLSLEFASFLYNIEKGEGDLALNLNRI